MVEILIKNIEEKITIKKWVMEKYNLTSSKVGKLIDNNMIKVNNKKTFFNYVLKENDILKLYFLKPKKIDYSFLKSRYKIEIFYEDQNIIIINKKRGVICQEDSKEKIETINNQIRKYLYEKKEWDPTNSDFIPNLNHRLDKYTIGLLIASKNQKTSIEINKALNDKKIQKIYECLVYGIPEKKHQILKNFIKENHEKNIMEIDNNNEYNKQIVTEYWLLETFKNFSLLKIDLKTGKKHQIRVHLSSINHPLLGDTKYNKINNMNFKYPCLVSKQIVFNFEKNSFLSYLNKKEFILKKYKFI